MVIQTLVKRDFNYLHYGVEELSRLFKTAILLLFTFQPSHGRFDVGWVNVDESLCFGKRSQHKCSQPEDIKTRQEEALRIRLMAHDNPLLYK